VLISVTRTAGRGPTSSVARIPTSGTGIRYGEISGTRSEVSRVMYIMPSSNVDRRTRSRIRFHSASSNAAQYQPEKAISTDISTTPATTEAASVPCSRPPSVRTSSMSRLVTMSPFSTMFSPSWTYVTTGATRSIASARARSVAASSTVTVGCMNSLPTDMTT